MEEPLQKAPGEGGRDELQSPGGGARGRAAGRGMCEHRPAYKQGQKSKGVLPGSVLYLRGQKWGNLSVAGAG